VAPEVKSDGQKNSLLRLAIRIAYNLAIDETRRIRSIPTDPETLDGLLEAHAGDVAEPDPLLRRTIELCHGQLPRRPRQALDLRLGGSLPGASDEALAKSIGVQLNTFLQNITRARKALAACLREHGIDLEAITQ
jgi:RNA polymerase sigma-70 factor (ECF subfamily)